MKNRLLLILALIGPKVVLAQTGDKCPCPDSAVIGFSPSTVKVHAGDIISLDVSVDCSCMEVIEFIEAIIASDHNFPLSFVYDQSFVDRGLPFLPAEPTSLSIFATDIAIGGSNFSAISGSKINRWIVPLLLGAAVIDTTPLEPGDYVIFVSATKEVELLELHLSGIGIGDGHETLEGYATITVVEPCLNDQDCMEDDPCDGAPVCIDSICTQLLEYDCNTNGVEDLCDLELKSSDCNLNGIPDECDIDCNDNGYPDDCDLTDGRSTDLDGDGQIDDCDNFNPIPTVSEWGLLAIAISLLILAKTTFHGKERGK